MNRHGISVPCRACKETLPDNDDVNGMHFACAASRTIELSRLRDEERTGTEESPDAARCRSAAAILLEVVVSFETPEGLRAAAAAWLRERALAHATGRKG